MTQNSSEELLYFWAIGDMHYRTLPAWQELHHQRFSIMLDDLNWLWWPENEGEPAFCISPGDVIEKGTVENYELAQREIQMNLSEIPFIAGIGNHEFYQVEGTTPEELFSRMWGHPVRHRWTINGVLCILLDYPSPLVGDPQYIAISQETLAFLEESLRAHPDMPALIFLHCPLRNTVLDRDPLAHRDYNSTQNFFSPENSQEIRDLLARHQNACLYFSGHTHSGWEAPQLVYTEELGQQTGEHPFTSINLMSPWYTGTHTGPRLGDENPDEPEATPVIYVADDPDLIITFVVRIYRDKAIIRAREHRTQTWLHSWTLPIVL